MIISELRKFVPRLCPEKRKRAGDEFPVSVRAFSTMQTEPPLGEKDSRTPAGVRQNRFPSVIPTLHKPVGLARLPRS